MLGPTIYLPSGLAKLLIPMTSSRGQRLALAGSLQPASAHRPGAADRVRVGAQVTWRCGRNMTCCTA
jgi:hypothetical protein